MAKCNCFFFFIKLHLICILLNSNRTNFENKVQVFLTPNPESKQIFCYCSIIMFASGTPFLLNNFEVLLWLLIIWFCFSNIQRCFINYLKTIKKIIMCKVKLPLDKHSPIFNCLYWEIWALPIYCCRSEFNKIIMWVVVTNYQSKLWSLERNDIGVQDWAFNKFYLVIFLPKQKNICF